MSASKRDLSVNALRWTVGVVVLLESLRFTFSASTVHHLSQMGLPSWVRFGLGGTEAVAALLFLLPATGKVGAYALLVIFAFAAIIHLLHGEFEIGGLAVYAMAVIVAMNHTEQAKDKVSG